MQRFTTWRKMIWKWRRGKESQIDILLLPSTLIIEKSNKKPLVLARYVREGGVTIGDIYIPPPPAPACTLDATGGD